MSAPRDADPAAVFSSIAGTSSAVEYPWLPSFVQEKLAAAAGRAESAVDASRARSIAMRAAIRAEHDGIPAAWSMREREREVKRRLNFRPPSRGPRLAPSLRTIRDELQQMDSEKAAGLGTETASERR